MKLSVLLLCGPHSRKKQWQALGDYVYAVESMIAPEPRKMASVLKEEVEDQDQRDCSGFHLVQSLTHLL